MELIEFLQEIRRDIQEQKIQSPASDEQIFTDIVTAHV